MSHFILSQIFAAFAFACGLISYQFKGRRSILLWMFGSASCNANHFYFLGRPGPACIALVVGARSLVSAFSINQSLMVLFQGLTVVGFFLTFQNSLSYLVLFAGLVAGYASFQQSDRKIRILFLLCGLMWLTHNLLAGSPVGSLMEATFVTSNLIGYWRFYHRGRSIDSADDQGMKRDGETDVRVDVRVGHG